MEKVNLMRKIAVKLSKEFSSNPSVIGILLSGSVALGKVHEKSDIDLIVIHDGSFRKDVKFIEGFKVEIWNYPMDVFRDYFESERLRNREDTWMWAGLWINLLKNSIILFDRQNLLHDWKLKAKNWKWSIKEINGAINYSLSNFNVARKFLSEDYFFSLVSIRDASYCLCSAYLMIFNRIPSIRPKDFYQEFQVVKDRTAFSKLFTWINDLTNLNENLLRELVRELGYWMERECKSKLRGPYTEYMNTVNLLRKGNFEVALLSARYASYWLCFQVLRNKGKQMKAKLYDSINHINTLSLLKSSAEVFYSFYRRIHFADKWDKIDISQVINDFEYFLSDVMRRAK
ncbi:MAG: nucleotidyltransferase domain-containing protein [archaeon GB-1867-035]|nr:nucleotidyltransferase domain-containing protein [Candidatus Culexmicrobium profundum]